MFSLLLYIFSFFKQIEINLTVTRVTVTYSDCYRCPENVEHFDPNDAVFILLYYTSLNTQNGVWYICESVLFILLISTIS